MLEYWIQNGASTSGISKDVLKDALSNIFTHDKKHTKLSKSLFQQLNVNNLDELVDFIYDSIDKANLNNRKTCSVCYNNGAFKMKGWMYPFIIAKDKFPNIYPNGKVETLNICKNCAYKCILALKNIKFYAVEDNVNCILFFADNPTNLKRFYNTLQESIHPEWNSNINKGIKLDSFYYPYELLTMILYDIAIRIADYKNYNLGALVLGFVSARKKIYHTTDIVNNLTPIINALKALYNIKEGKVFPLLFKGLKEGSTNRDPSVFIKRELLLKDLLNKRTINWSVLEDIIFYNIHNNKTVPFIYDFCMIIMDEFKMTDKELFDQVSSEGYRLGQKLLEKNKNDIKKAKSILYELRRKRKLEEFLDEINILQLTVEEEFYDKPFKDNPEKFPKLKTFFLIGMTNAVFRSNKKQTQYNTDNNIDDKSSNEGENYES